MTVRKLDCQSHAHGQIPEEIMTRTDRIEAERALDPFFADGLITEVVSLVRKGTEATVYCCRGSAKISTEYLAAKIYRPREPTGFRDSARRLSGTLWRALTNKSSQESRVQLGVRVRTEFETLKLLHAAGSDVPEPVACADSSLLMEFIGVGTAPAPLLNRVEMEPAQARECRRAVFDNVALWLRYHRIHADLAPYNILYRERGIVVIDFPQAVDARFNTSARDMLSRDVENVCRYFSKFGLGPDPQRIARELWSLYSLGKL
jgi:RIO kinase 1